MIRTQSTVIALLLLLAAELANAECNFVYLNNRSPLGQSLKQAIEHLGPSGYSRLPDEGGRSFEKSEFHQLGVVAPLADVVWFGTYKDIVFETNLRYAKRSLKSARVDLVKRLDACAKRLNAECWRDESANYFQIGNDSRDTYLYMVGPRFGSPDDPDLPPKSCR